METIENLLQKKNSPSLIGFLQAAGVVIYCGFVAVFFFYMSQTKAQPGFFGFFLMLALFVFSAAITGSLVFGYPAYLVLNKRIKEAINILTYTLLFSLIIILISIILIISLAG